VVNQSWGGEKDRAINEPMGMSSKNGPCKGPHWGMCRTDVSVELMDVTFLGPWLGDVQMGQCVP
jgi:hypothetical protein